MLQCICFHSLSNTDLRVNKAGLKVAFLHPLLKLASHWWVSPRNKHSILNILKHYKNCVIHFSYEFSNRPEVEFSLQCKPMHHPYDDVQIREQKINLNFLICNLMIKLFLFSLYHTILSICCYFMQSKCLIFSWEYEKSMPLKFFIFQCETILTSKRQYFYQHKGFV